MAPVCVLILFLVLVLVLVLALARASWFWVLALRSSVLALAMPLALVLAQPLVQHLTPRGPFFHPPRATGTGGGIGVAARLVLPFAGGVESRQRRIFFDDGFGGRRLGLSLRLLGILLRTLLRIKPRTWTKTKTRTRTKTTARVGTKPGTEVVWEQGGRGRV